MKIKLLEEENKKLDKIIEGEHNGNFSILTKKK
jgi:hypothetical protein